MASLWFVYWCCLLLHMCKRSFFQSYLAWKSRACLHNNRIYQLNSLKGEPFQENFDVAMDTLCDDLNREELEAQLITLKFYPDEPIIDAKELVKFLQGLTPAQRRLMPAVVILAKVLLIMPAANAVSERSFFALKRWKHIWEQEQKKSGLITWWYCMSIKIEQTK